MGNNDSHMRVGGRKPFHHCGWTETVTKPLHHCGRTGTVSALRVHRNRYITERVDGETDTALRVEGETDTALRVDGNRYVQHCGLTEIVTALRVDRNRYILTGGRKPLQYWG